MLSKFPGTCHRCGGPIDEGDYIYWAPRVGAYHTRCAPNQEEASKAGINEPKDSASWVWLDKIVVLLPLGLGPAIVLFGAKTAFFWFFSVPFVLALLNNGLAKTGGLQRVKWSFRPRLKVDLYIEAIMAMAMLSAIPGLILWAVLKFFLR